MRRGVGLLAVLALAGCTLPAGDPLAPGGEAPAAGAETAATPSADAGSEWEALAEEAPAEAAGTPAAEAAPAPPRPVLPGTPGSSPAEADKAFAEAYGAPQIYMALQPDPSGPTSIVFAIDKSRDNTPSDEPAIRLTPLNGKCNPQQLRYYNFPPEAAGRPVYGPDEAYRGITAKELPEFMAVAVTARMLESGLISDPEESHPQNVCTRKLYERLIVAQSLDEG